MRFLFVTPTYLPAMRYGGPIMSVHGMAQALVSLGHTVNVFTTNVDGDSVSAVPLEQAINVDGVWVTYFECSGLKRLYFSLSLRSALAKQIKSFDIVITQAVFLYPGLVAAAMARRNSIPYIMTPRGMLVKELLNQKSRYLKKMWLTIFERRNLLHSAAIHFTSQLERVDYCRLKLPVVDSFVIANGVDSVAQPTGAHNGKADLVFIGRISWKKQLHILIDVAEKLKSKIGKLVIVGNDDEGLWPILESQVKSKGLEKKVKYEGAVYGPAKKKYYRKGNIFITISVNENFCNAALEALANGIPVVLGDKVGLAEEAATQGIGRMVKNDVEAISNEVETLLDSDELYNEMSTRAIECISDRYTWSELAKQYARQVKKILECRT